MGTLSFKDLTFYAYHGVFKEEQKIGTYFTVDLIIDTDFSKVFASDYIGDTIDYTKVYQCIKTQMEIKSNTIEHLLHRVGQMLKQEFKAKKIDLTITKHHPPFKGIPSVSVSDSF